MESICRGAPEHLQYFLAYAIQMNFEGASKFDDLLLISSARKRGICEVQRILAAQERNNDNPQLGSKPNKRGVDDDEAPLFHIPKHVKINQLIIVSEGSYWSISSSTMLHITYFIL